MFPHWLTPARPRRIWPDAALHARLVADRAWVAEPKKCGHRCIVVATPEGVELWTRHRGPARFPSPNVRATLARFGLPPGTVLDGEVMQTDELWLFDALAVAGERIDHEPLRVRRRRLADLLPNGQGGGVVGLLPRYLDKSTAYLGAIAIGDEGVVLKTLDRPYPHGETLDWIKIKRADRPGG